MDYFQQLLSQSPQSNSGLVVTIFKQNITASLLALFGGIILGILPVIIVASNGLLIGYVIHYLIVILPESVGVKILILAATLLPHGIFELPIVLLSAALGMQWGIAWLLPSAKGQRKAAWKKHAQEAFAFIPLLIIVLAVAAFIEVNVSARLAGVLLAARN